MKRRNVLAAALALSMAGASCLPGLAMAEEYVTASVWTEEVPEDFDVYAAEGPTYASAYYGLWSKTVAVGQVVDSDTEEVVEPGVEKEYCVYTPTNWVAAGSCVYVVAPEGYTAEEFANASSWMEVADEYGISVAFFAGEDGHWDLEALEDSLDYIIAAANDMSSRSIINYNESSLYIVGYGEGSTVANYAAMNLANMFAGAVLMGTPEISEAEIETIGNTCEFDKPLYGGFTERNEGYYLKNVNIPVWMVNDGEANEALETYWKEANDVSGDVTYNDYAVIYSQDELFEDQQAEYEAASYVWVSSMEQAAENYDYEFTAYMWENFLSKLLRLRAQQDGTLYYNSYEKLEELEYYQTEIDGVTRYWAVYTPESYDGTEELPMLLFLHGHAHGISAFFVNSGLWRAAEKYNFVLVFGLAEPCTWCGSVDCYRWTWRGDGVETEMQYIETVLDEVQAGYSIDTSRVYCMSHSNGSECALAVAEYLPQRFAAFAPVGSPMVLYSSEEELPEADDTSVKYGLTVIYGTAESEYKPEKVEMMLKRAMLADGMDLDTQAVTTYNGEYTVNTYYDETNGLPLVKFYLRDDTIHTVLPEYCDIAWNDLSAYSRGEDGTLYYGGVAVE